MSNLNGFISLTNYVLHFVQNRVCNFTFSHLSVTIFTAITKIILNFLHRK